MPRQRAQRVVRVEVELPEILVASIHQRAVSAGEFVEFVVNHIQLDELLNAFIGTAADRTSSAGGGVQVSTAAPIRSNETPESGILSRGPPMLTPTRSASIWTSTVLAHFFETVEADPAFIDGLALLAAYAKRGPSPTSSELAIVCGFTDPDLWTQSLRSTKNALNSQARRMGLPPLFLRPQTIRSERVHPLNPTVYAWIRDWFKDSIREEVNPSHWGLRANERTRAVTEGRRRNHESN